MGAIGAGLLRLLLLDRSFERFLRDTYLPPAKHFDDTGFYFPYALTIAAVIIVAVVIQLPKLIARGFISWKAGVTSGLCLLSFLSTFVVLALYHTTFQKQLLADLGAIAFCFALGFGLYLKARVDAERPLEEKDLQVPLQTRSIAGTNVSESDDPIRTWEEDTLGRAALVENISIKLMIGKRPLLSLFGEFGSGKTSVLNLLREHLEEKAIVVSFNTWLPGSQETLTSYLLADIATECHKHYVVPGLRKSAQRFANALAQSVPFLKGYPELFPAATQRDDLESVRTALTRLPRRVIVLLDELDRMEKAELLTLLKVVRGISALPNLSFVCASNREAIVNTVKGEFSDQSNLYFEKFSHLRFRFPMLTKMRYGKLEPSDCLPH